MRFDPAHAQALVELLLEDSEAAVVVLRSTAIVAWSRGFEQTLGGVVDPQALSVFAAALRAATDGSTVRLPTSHGVEPPRQRVRRRSMAGGELELFTLSAAEPSLAELLASNTLLQETIDLLDFPIYLSDLDDRYLLQNRASRAILDAVGRTPTELEWAGFDKGQWLDSLRAVKTSGQGLRAEFEIDYGDQVRQVAVNLEPLRHGGRVVGCFAYNVDRTALRDFEALATRRARQLEELLDLLPIPAELLARDGSLIAVNGAWEAQLGIPRKRAVGSTLQQLGILADSDAARAMEQALVAGAPATFTRSLELPSGSSLVQAAACCTLDLVDQAALVLVGLDITEAQLDAERRARRERLLSMGQLAASIAHDFNNVLMGVLGHAEFIESASTDSAAREAAADIAAAALAAAALVRRLLGFARQGTEQRRLSAPELAASTVALFHQARWPVQVTVSPQASALTITGNLAQLQNALLNALFNARDAMPSGGPIRLLVECADSAAPTVRFSVEDSGTGMTEAVLQRCRETFFTTKSHGTGLGMLALQTAATEHGGTFVVESTLGVGTRVMLTLPAAFAAESREAG